MSPNATASATDPARALGPAAAARSLSCLGWRDENITGWPSLANIVPSAPPSLPAPIVAILRVERSCASALDAGPGISAATKISNMRRGEGQKMCIIARLGKGLWLLEIYIKLAKRNSRKPQPVCIGLRTLPSAVG